MLYIITPLQLYLLCVKTSLPHSLVYHLMFPPQYLKTDNQVKHTVNSSTIMDVKCVCVSARVRVVMMSFRCRNYILFWLHRATFFNKFPCFSCPCHRFSDRLSISSSALNDYSVVLRFGFLCCAFAAQMFPLSSSDMMMMMIKCFQPDPDYREYVVLYIAPLLSDEDLWSRVLREVTIL